MGQEEVARYSGLFKTLVDGFVPPAWDLPFTPYGKGMAARCVCARVQGITCLFSALAA